MNQGGGQGSGGPRKHKRAMRKKLQKSYEVEHREDMIRQMERRFPGNQPSTSSASCSSAPIADIPLPESETPAKEEEGVIPRLTEADYAGQNFMKDPKVVTTHSAELKRSQRIVRMAEDAERQMLTRTGTTIETVLSEFREKVLNVCKEKRLRQTDVPSIEHPNHRKDGEVDASIPEREDLSYSESDDDAQLGSASEPEPEEVKADRKDIRKKAQPKTKKERHEESMRQVNLTRMSLERKKNHPNALHSEVQFNEKGLANDTPECRCPVEARESGLRHGYYPGENKPIDCIADNSILYTYTLSVEPCPRDGVNPKTEMSFDGVSYELEGFSLVTHEPLPDCMTQIPICRYGIEFTYQLTYEPIPNGCYYSEDTIYLQEYIFHEVFEMLDFSLRPKSIPEHVPSCPVIHIMPRYVQKKDGVVYLCSTKTILAYLLEKCGQEMFTAADIFRLCKLPDNVFYREMKVHRQTIVLNAEKKPSAVRADSFERDTDTQEIFFVYNSLRSNSYPGALRARVARLERKLEKMQRKERYTGTHDPEIDSIRQELHSLRIQKQDRFLRVRQNVFGYTNSGFKPDMAAYVIMTILASHHIRYNFSLSFFEKTIGYRFNDRKVIELAMINPSMKTHYGTSNDHVKNLINNCGYRMKYNIDEKRERKKGVVTLYTIMTGQSSTEPILHNERLEYLGDAVVELIASHHLFFMLPHHHEGGLATYRTALVQNRNLANLALKIGIDGMLQYAHGAELCNEGEWKHALANAFEALMAAVFLDGGLAPCDMIFSSAMYGDDPELKEKWDHVNEHELKREDPLGDRELSMVTPTLASFHELEKSLGIQFNNIRLLVKAFTRRNVPPNDLTKGHNQRLEWLGDSVLQLIVSDYLYKNFPLHHEGHMSLLRTSLVSNQTQAVVCDDLGFSKYVVKAPYMPSELKMKDKADLVEAFIGALYVDRGIEHCRSFVRIVFCPRLKHFIDNEKWNDAKSHLQQWCLLDRGEDNGLPEIPEYRLLSCEGSTNSRIYKVAVYFRGRRLATAESNNLHQAQLKVAELALSNVDISNISEIRDKKRSMIFREDSEEKDV